MKLTAFLLAPILLLSSPSDESELVDKILQKGQATAVKVLADYGTEEALKGLQTVLQKSKRWQVIQEALLSLAVFKDDEKLGPKALRLLVTSTNDRTEYKQEFAVEGLIAFGEPAEKALHKVVASSRNSTARSLAVRGLFPSLSKDGSTKGLKIVLENARLEITAGRPELRAVLDAFQGPEIVEAMGKSFGGRKIEGYIQILMAESLAERDGAEVDQALRQALRCSNPGVHYVAIKALRRRDPTPHLGEFLRLSHSEDPAVQRVALLAIGDIQGSGDDWETKVLAQARRKSAPIHRQVAARFLGELGSDAAAEALYELLVDKDRRVRAATLDPIVMLRRKDSIPLLIERIDLESGRMKRDIPAALRLITGIDLGKAARRWRLWWRDRGEAFALPTLEEAEEAERLRAVSRQRQDSEASFYGIPIDSDRLCFVLDTSGSMYAEAGEPGRNRLDVASAELVGVLDKLSEEAFFNVIFFDSDARPWKGRPIQLTKRVRRRAKDFILSQEPGGSTELFEALKLAFQYEKIDTLYLLTDGYPSGSGLQDLDQIKVELERWNSTQFLQIHGVSIGEDNELVRALTELTGGRYVVK